MTLGGYFVDFGDILEHVWSIFQYLDPMGHQNEPQGGSRITKRRSFGVQKVILNR